MDVTQVSAATAASNTTSNTNSVLSSDFEVFLQMLTAQAEYQDPLEPIDSSEYAAQLAQFSMVEQQVSTNDLLEQMLVAFGANDMSGAANWIGLEALVTGPVQFEGAPITISPNPPVAADAVELVVYNAQGTEVQRRTLPVGAEPYVWDGLNAAGSPLAYGEYTLKVESSANGEVLTEDPALSYTRVTEARIDNGTTLLVLQNGYMIEAANVIGLREPA
ncbi:flagellar hook capping FlgD N-terminal domain-containing protein [uncultured Tateyamaria sp.]|uniref:flagellar hook capping FlgD N-terminal domain-containing protein n=1 Tax=Tateyamaria sp. 1078 TaxID=3417464 RepID=UPI00260BC34D|nr:flagellar hook capping FlgD N-terminal domain-containing protein [uncultured Tateyamaria sp.]